MAENIAHVLMNSVDQNGVRDRLHRGENVPGVSFLAQEGVNVLAVVFFSNNISKSSFHGSDIVTPHGRGCQ